MTLTKFQNFYQDYLWQLDKALGGIDSAQVFKAVDLIQSCRGTVWLIGNGGSAALASHMATDLQLAGVRAISLTDVAAITTIGNDTDFEHTFMGQLLMLAQGEGDVLIAISGSGTSPNIVAATSWAMNHGIYVIGVTGFKGGSLCTNLNLHIPSTHMGVAQDGHQIVLHMICYYLMKRRKIQ